MNIKHDSVKSKSNTGNPNIIRAWRGDVTLAVPKIEVRYLCGGGGVLPVGRRGERVISGND